MGNIWDSNIVNRGWADLLKELIIGQIVTDNRNIWPQKKQNSQQEIYEKRGEEKQSSSSERIKINLRSNQVAEPLFQDKWYMHT